MRFTRATLTFLLVSAAPVAAQLPRVAPGALVTISATSPDGEVVIGNVSGATLMPDGRVAVADGTVNMILVFAPDGTLQRRLGGTGGGPGEFRRLGGVVACGGRLHGYEVVAQSLIAFDPDNGRHRNVKLVSPLFGLVPITCLSGGRLAGMTNLRPTGSPTPEAPLVPARASVVVLDSTGQQLADFEVERALEVAVVGGAALPRPLGPLLRVGALGGELVFGTGAAGSITIPASNGTRQVPLPLTTGRPSKADRQAAEDALLALVPEAARDKASQALARIPVADSLPYYRGMLASPEGTIWLLTSPPSADRATWAVTDGRRLIGRVTLPTAGELLGIGKDRVLILAIDAESGEQRLEVHRMR